MLTVITWYLAMQLFALAAWPLLFGMGDRLHDRGYALAKGFGLVLITYIVWALAHLGGKLSILGFSFQSVSVVWFSLLILSLVSLMRHGGPMARWIRQHKGYLVTLEALVLAGFIAMVALKAQVPHISYNKLTTQSDTMLTGPLLIDHAAEKFTDFAVLNSLLTSSAFPPHDAWVSGDSLNYYYFGHMLWATMIKFTSVRPEVGFNLAMASAFALVLGLAFGLGYNLTRRLRWGLLMAFLIALCSNLDGFLQVITALKTAWVDEAFREQWGYTDQWWRNYSFWRSSRAIENTINEFPAFSFILGDLHAHVSALLINLCGWNLAVQIWRSVRRTDGIARWEINALDELLIAALIFGALSASNSWDVPLFAAVLTAAIYSGYTGRRDPYAWLPAGQAISRRLVSFAAAACISGVTAVVGALLLFAPFMRNFHPPRPAEGGMIKWVNVVNKSDSFEFLSHWMLLGIIPAISVWSILRHRRVFPSLDVHPSLPTAPRFAIFACLAAVVFVMVPLSGGWVGGIMLALGALLSTAVIVLHLPPLSRWLLSLLAIFCLMTSVCEFIYVDDIFEGAIERINTVFKVYYGLWTLMAVCAVMALRLILRFPAGGHRFRRAAWLLLPLLIAGSPYMVLGTLNRLNTSTRLGKPDQQRARFNINAPLFSEKAKPTNLDEALDGMRYMAIIHPDDYAAIQWIRRELPTTATLLEAAGDQYTYSGRMGTMTGRPSYAGWLMHAWGWRGNGFDKEMMERTSRVAQMYNTDDPELAWRDLLLNDINYVVVGEQERRIYPAINEQKFAVLGTEVFRQGSTAVYRVNKPGSSDSPEAGKPAGQTKP